MTYKVVKKMVLAVIFIVCICVYFLGKPADVGFVAGMIPVSSCHTTHPRVFMQLNVISTIQPWYTLEN